MATLTKTPRKVIGVEGMHCEKCVARVKDALEKLDGVKSAKVDLDSNSATVKGDVADDVLTAAIEDLGFKVTSIA